MANEKFSIDLELGDLHIVYRGDPVVIAEMIISAMSQTPDIEALVITAVLASAKANPRIKKYLVKTLLNY